MNELNLYLAVQQARQLLDQGLGLADGSRVAAKLHSVNWHDVMAYAMRATEGCYEARRALQMAQQQLPIDIDEEAEFARFTHEREALFSTGKEGKGGKVSG